MKRLFLPLCWTALVGAAFGQASDPPGLPDQLAAQDQRARAMESRRRSLKEEMEDWQRVIKCIGMPTLRTWTDKTGQFTVNASFVRIEDDVLILQSTKVAKNYRIPLKSVSANDRKWALGESRRAAELARQKKAAEAKEQASPFTRVFSKPKPGAPSKQGVKR